MTDAEKVRHDYPVAAVRREVARGEPAAADRGGMPPDRASNPVTAAELRATQLSAVMRGYSPKEVDKALNAALQELEQRGT
jgi:DivIVA domain-containing protein